LDSTRWPDALISGWFSAANEDFGFEMASPEQCRPVSPHARASLADRLPAFATHPSLGALLFPKTGEPVTMVFDSATSNGRKFQWIEVMDKQPVAF
jgi:hypothetical protein